MYNYKSTGKTKRKIPQEFLSFNSLLLLIVRFFHLFYYAFLKCSPLTSPCVLYWNREKCEGRKRYKVLCFKLHSLHAKFSYFYFCFIKFPTFISFEVFEFFLLDPCSRSSRDPLFSNLSLSLIFSPLSPFFQTVHKC